MKKLIFAASVVVFAFFYANSLQAQSGTQRTKGATKTATQNPGAPMAGPGWRAGAGCYGGRAKMSGRNC
jgi:hypothetical protein